MLSPMFKLAVLSGTQSAVQFHIQRGLDINATDKEGRSPVMLAALKGNVEICRLLLEAGADPTSSIGMAKTLSLSPLVTEELEPEQLSGNS